MTVAFANDVATSWYDLPVVAHLELGLRSVNLFVRHFEFDAFTCAGSGRRTVHGQSDAARDQCGSPDGEGGLLYKASAREVIR